MLILEMASRARAPLFSPRHDAYVQLKKSITSSMLLKRALPHYYLEEKDSTRRAE
jgi:hypothetical protein